MKTTRTLFQGIFLICMILVLLFFQNEVRDFIIGIKDIMYGAFGPSYDLKKIETVEAENKSLKKQVDLLKLKMGMREENNGKIIANVYSTYPFNDKVHITIDKGSDDGMDIGMPILFEGNILIGKVVSVKKTQSEVQTVFDPEWKTSVAVGTSSVKAVLTGGNNPEVGFIPKDAVIREGDEIVNTASEFPMHTFIGTVKSVSLDEKKIWQNAIIDFPISLESIDSVIILTKFP